jgi:hypothetical protein
MIAIDIVIDIMTSTSTSTSTRTSFRQTSFQNVWGLFALDSRLAFRFLIIDIWPWDPAPPRLRPGPGPRMGVPRSTGNTSIVIKLMHHCKIAI